MCGIDLATNSTKRKGFNVITKYSNTSDLDNPSTPQNEAICWLLEEIDETDSIDELKIAQRYNLAVMYFSTNGTQWGKKTKWIDHNEKHCDWHGVQCSNYDGIVSALDLSLNNLAGYIPIEV